MIEGIMKLVMGIDGFDDLIFGGLFMGWLSLVCGLVGCGKMLFVLMFFFNGMRFYDEFGVFVMFEEWFVDIVVNVDLFGFDL